MQDVNHSDQTNQNIARLLKNGKASSKQSADKENQFIVTKITSASRPQDYAEGPVPDQAQQSKAKLQLIQALSEQSNSTLVQKGKLTMASRDKKNDQKSQKRVPEKSVLEQTVVKDKSVKRQEVSPMHIHYHNHNYIKVVSVSPNNASLNKSVTRTSSVNKQGENTATNRKRSVQDKPSNQSVGARRSSANRQSNPTTSPIATARSAMKQPQQDKKTLEFAQQLQDKLYRQQQQDVMEDSIDHITAATTIHQQSSSHNPKQVIFNKLSRYIKLKQGEFSPNVSDEILDNLKEFLGYLEKKKIINITQLENDQGQLNSLIQDIMKLDLSKFSQSRQTLQKQDSSGSSQAFHQARGSVSSNKASRRQGTPVGHLPQQTNQSDSTLSSSISNLSNFQKRRGSVLNYSSDEKQQSQQRVRVNSNNSKAGSQIGGNPSTTINLNINAKVGSININPIHVNPQTLLQPHVQTSTASNQKHILLSSQLQAEEGHSQQRKASVGGGSTNTTSANSNVGARRGSDGQIIQQRTNKHIGKQDESQAPQQHQRRVGSAEQKRDGSKMRADSGQRVQDRIEFADSGLNEQIMKEREKIIKYNKVYIKKKKLIPPTSLEYYKSVKLIGKGAFGKVTLGIHKLTGKYVAIKAIDKSYMKDDYSKKKVFQEVYILRKIRHSNIIRLLEVFESPKHFLMVMEYAGGGDLLQYVKQKKRLEEQEAKYMFKQIVYGLAHCHCRSVLHRDIKLDNILMDHEGGIKICDFGVSRLVQKGQMIQEQCGTPAYLAPEIIADEGYEGFYVDIWSLGVLLYTMLQGTVPFRASNLQDLHALILKGNFKYPVDISPQGKDLIEKMLVLVPSNRISIPEILTHSWLKGASDPDGFEGTDDDDDHDFKMGLSFQRQECNLNPLMENTQDKSPLYQGGNINQVNIDNLFYDGNFSCKLSYSNYCAVSQDYYTHRIDEEAIRILENFGYPRSMVIDSLNKGEMNHATASYNLLVLP